jgi:MFS family permease
MEKAIQNQTALNKRETIFSPFIKSKHFSFLFFGQVLSLLGSSISMVILPVIVYQLTNSTAAMGMVMAFYMLPHVLILPFSGIIVDRLNRVKIMLITDLVRFLIVSLFAVLAFTDQLQLSMLYMIVAILGLMDGIFQPAFSAVRAKVFTPDIRTSANSIMQISIQGIRIIGPALGGVIITYFSLGVGLGIDALTYILSFIFILFLGKLKFKQDNNTRNKMSIKTDFMEGISVLKKDAWLWVTILSFSLINICLGGVTRILVPWLVTIHHGFEPYVFGLVLSASGAGAIVCAVIYGMRQTWKYRGLLAYGGIAVAGIALIFMPFISNIPFLMLLMFVNGAGYMLFGLIWEISLQEMVPEEKFGRVASLDMLGSFALLPLGYIFTGWLAEQVGGTYATMILSLFIVLIVVISISSKGVRQYN